LTTAAIFIMQASEFGSRSWLMLDNLWKICCSSLVNAVSNTFEASHPARPSYQARLTACNAVGNLENNGVLAIQEAHQQEVQARGKGWCEEKTVRS
jgi:hypothetical protein